jgi:L-seryl-tRNA(Ser) seleniumtransferase
MEKNNNRTEMLRSLPGVDRMLERLKAVSAFDSVPRSVQIAAIRWVVDKLRSEILDSETGPAVEAISESVLLERIQQRASQLMSPRVKHLVNATGVIVHTNLGRSLLAAEALNNLMVIGGGYSNLEFNLETGKRGSRYSHVEDLLCEITGAESAMVVNNNAGAVLLCLDTIARGKQVIVSRGELVEIGGSFRIPDVMAKSGAQLKEVGTTNRTHLKDYESAVNGDTGMLLKVHTSNYSVVGFTASVGLDELVRLGEKYQLPVMEDLGSGTFIDFAKYDLQKEPTVQESIRAGVDIVTFSGDKLLGGPQAGIIAGATTVIDKIKQNPLTRALRIDKLTLAALESTLKFYREEEKAVASIPTLRMMTVPLNALERQAELLARALTDLNEKRLKITRLDSFSRVGGGSLPLLRLPTCCVGAAVEGLTVNSLDRLLRESDPPVIGRIEDDKFLMDVRTMQPDDRDSVAGVFKRILDRCQQGAL